MTRHADIKAVSRNAGVFSSAQGTQFDTFPPEVLELSQSFVATDNPEHARLRGLVSSAFTPRRVRQFEEAIAADAQVVVDELGEGDLDFVQAVSRRLPAMTIMRMLGVLEAEREQVLAAVESAVSWNDPEFLGDRNALEMMGEVVGTFQTVAQQMAAHREQHPADDLMAALVQAEIDGKRLTRPEIGAFFVLLSVAGNDMTRQTTSHAMLALTRFPEQRRALMADLDGKIDVAVEEFVRWATPVMTFRRTTTEETQLSGETIPAGAKVVPFYSSGNRDEAAFDEPDRFDVTRTPNHHLGFGGGGPHYCMGAPLAKMQLRALFTRLLRAYPDLEVGEPHYLVSNFANAIGRLPMVAGARA